MHARLLAAVFVIASSVAANAASKDENLAQDPGFEVPGEEKRVFLHWEHFSSKSDNIAMVDTSPRSGKSCARVWCQGTKNAHLGIAQIFDVVPKGRYVFRVHVLNDKNDKLSGDVVGNLGIEWYDAEGGEISRVSSKEWDGKLSKMSWQEYEVDAKAPQFATKVKFVIYLREGERGGKGACFIDDAEIIVK
jgi:hypothetical protein